MYTDKADEVNKRSAANWWNCKRNLLNSNGAGQSLTDCQLDLIENRWTFQVDSKKFKLE